MCRLARTGRLGHTRCVKIALAQLDPTPGDLDGNRARIETAYAEARAAGAELVAAPELALVGYPPRDLLRRQGFLDAAAAALEALAAITRDGPPLVVGTVTRNPDPHGRGIHNAAVVLADGAVLETYAKQLLPTYDVFDEARYFEPGKKPGLVTLPSGHHIALLVCEDLWFEDTVDGRQLYAVDPVRGLEGEDLDLIVGISASPYHGGKDRYRTALFAAQAKRLGTPLLAVNQVGANDDVLFDGRSRVFDGEGRTIAALPAFETQVAVVDLEGTAPIEVPEPEASREGRAEEIRKALVMGIAGYCRKTGFRKALLGVSGGVDSAVVACLAADALGPENVFGVSMPGPFTASMSNEDAEALASALGIGYTSISIKASYETALEALAPSFEGTAFGVAEENIQARLRGLMLMALSNKHGHLVLTTGNKSEVAVGYCTLYGDMNGGLAVLSDVWKTTVYDIARLYEAQGRLPTRTITRPPSAELRENQTDQDSLPAYEDLDRILRLRIEEGLGHEAIVARGEDAATVERILKLVARNEYKRWQMAPGLKVTPTAFGVGWRMPLAKPAVLY